MRIYFSGIGGAALGPLARLARDAGHEVLGSDATASRNTRLVAADGIKVYIGQSGREIEAAHQAKPIDWLVHTSSLPKNHPEIKFARDNGIKASDRTELINTILDENNLKMLAVAGTHGKTNTTGLLVWTLEQLGLPVSYSVGTNIPWGPNGKHRPDSRYFVYEADEFAKSFLAFKPFASLIPAVDYDHPDTYATVDEYKAVFKQFIDRSENVITWRQIGRYLGVEGGGTTALLPEASDGAGITLLGKYTRKNARLVLELTKRLLPKKANDERLAAINSFPGTERRMEKLADNIYSDFAHHPVEITAAIEAAAELGKPVVAVYQPHQNIRQHHIKDQYGGCFARAEKVYWLPTYLSREYQKMDILSPSELVAGLADPSIAETAVMDEGLAKQIKQHAAAGKTVLLMSAGDLDEWARENFS